MMFKTERKLRVACAISDELFFQRHGFMPQADQTDGPDTGLISVAEVALLAADGDLDVIDTLRRDRERMIDLLLGQADPRPVKA